MSFSFLAGVSTSLPILLAAQRARGTACLCLCFLGCKAEASERQGDWTRSVTTVITDAQLRAFSVADRLPFSERGLGLAQRAGTSLPGASSARGVGRLVLATGSCSFSRPPWSQRGEEGESGGRPREAAGLGPPWGPRQRTAIGEWLCSVTMKPASSKTRQSCSWSNPHLPPLPPPKASTGASLLQGWTSSIGISGSGSEMQISRLHCGPTESDSALSQEPRALVSEV